MTRNRSITISSALIATALTAVAGVHGQDAYLDLKSSDIEDNPFASRVEDAASRAGPQAMIRGATPALVKTIRVDRELLADAYAEPPSGDRVAQAMSELLTGPPEDLAYLDDSTTSAGMYNCYQNCHNACHGSRWFR